LSDNFFLSRTAFGYTAVTPTVMSDAANAKAAIGELAGSRIICIATGAVGGFVRSTAIEVVAFEEAHGVPKYLRHGVLKEVSDVAP